MNNVKIKQPRGFILVSTVLVMSVLLLLALYVVNFTITEFKISTSQSIATRTYYLAEAGISQMIWKIQNDTATSDAFLGGTLSAANDISITGVFGDNNAAYQVAAISTAPGEAQIIATSTYQVSSVSSQRVVKSYISQATGNNDDWDFGIFSGGRGSQQNGNLTFKGSGTVFTANDTRLHANQELKVQGVEIIVNDGAATASNVINVVSGGTLTLNNSFQEAPTSTIDILQIDFDAWQNRATVTYSSSDFANLPDGTTLNGVIYVLDDCEIDKKNFTINGVLLCNDDAEIIIDGSQTITINPDPTYGGGLLARDDAKITTNNGVLYIRGIVYSGDDLDIESDGTSFTIDGSLAGFDTEVTGHNQSIVLNFIPDNFTMVIDPAMNTSSPIIQIDHWEEEY